ncbi:hypothetical protein I5Q82_08270 [Acutalibacter muris]|uniref:Uncharacterized protein n=1 Tax=Acutalibacter muris TaxID=1796620 RepID=A0AA92L9T3_9FIRM|nr:hypothetical protein [Acutalibacter muris]QQR31636.1 hypothetical protein I5Q82_08270 [Acutalibacter muris]
MSVPIGDVLGIMTTLIVGFINIIVLLLMALIDAKKVTAPGKVRLLFCKTKF